MSKFTTISIVLSLCFSTLGLVMAKNQSEKDSKVTSKIANNETPTLENWSIAQTWKPIKHVSYSMDWKPKPNKLRNLVNPENGNIVAIVQFKDDGSTVLNPRELLSGGLKYDYGPIPNLKDFTIELVDVLFGKNLSNTEMKTYSLKVKGTADLCYLDLLFSKGKLNKYRVRMSKTKPGSWISVN